MSGRVVVVNPLGVALRHYVDELHATLRAAGSEPEVLSQPEPSASGRSRIAWVLHHFWMIRTAARTGERQHPVVVVWPALGHLDALFLWLFARRRGWLMIHDPEPLVRAVGYGKSHQFLARCLTRTRYMAQSAEAERVLAVQGFRSRTSRLPHPCLPPSAGRADRAEVDVPRVSVVGQFKPDRDLALLERLAPRLKDAAHLRIYGRGWPAVGGWTVDSRFLPEDELDEVIRSSAVVLIPYRRFYQSGIAIRAVELGVPVVGPRDSSLSEIFGVDSPLLPADGSADAWQVSIETALDPGRSNVDESASRYWAETVRRWSAWNAGDEVRLHGG